MSPAVLIWVQHLLGTGHLRRAVTLADALAGAGACVTLASGGSGRPWPVAPGVRFAQLEPIASADAAFSQLITSDGRPVEAACWQDRSRQLGGLVRETAPAIVVTELFPFGRSAFRSEVLGLLEQARRVRPGCAVVASVRDVLVTKPEPKRLARMRDTARAHYDAVLVHGDERLIPFGASFPLAAELGARLFHTGYLTAARPARTGHGRAEVLVSAGGGRVGAKLLETALRARTIARMGSLPWRLVTGGGLDPAAEALLAGLASEGVTIDRRHDTLQPLLDQAVVSVSQAGYNTVVEALAARAPMVLVPFATEIEDEQTVRARQLAAKGLARWLPESALTPPALAALIDQAAAAGAPATSWVNLDGAAVAAARIMDLAAARHAA